MKKFFLVIMLGFVLVSSHFSLTYSNNISSISNLNNEFNNISYELNEYDLNNKGVKENFTPYTNEEKISNDFDTRIIKIKIFFKKYKYVFLVGVIIIGFLLFQLKSKEDKDKENE